MSEPAAPKTTGGRSQTTFILLTAALLAIGAATVLRSPRMRARWATSGARRRRPETREVIAELVQTAPIAAPTAALAPPAPAEPKVAEPEPAFEPELLLPAAAAAEATTQIVATQEEVADEPTEEFCQIAVWRGYAKSRFFARLELDNGTEQAAVAESPTFWLRGNGVPERTAAAQAAHTALLGLLLEEGWVVEGAPDPWYADRLRRSLEEREAVSPAVQT